MPKLTQTTLTCPVTSPLYVFFEELGQRQRRLRQGRAKLARLRAEERRVKLARSCGKGAGQQTLRWHHVGEAATLQRVLYE